MKKLERVIKLGMMLGMAAIGIVMGFQSNSYALTMQFWSDGPLLTVADNGPGDLNPAVGSIRFEGNLGRDFWSASISSTYPALGSKSDGMIEIAGSISHYDANPASLKILVSEQGYTGPISGEQFPFNLYAGGWTTGLATFSAYLNSNTELASLGPYSGEFSATIGGLAAATAPFSLTLGADFQSIGYATGGNNEFYANINAATAPEPATLLLLGSGLLGTGIFGRKKLGKSKG